MRIIANFRINKFTSHCFGSILKKKTQPAPVSVITLLRQTVEDTRVLCKPSTHKNKVTAVNILNRFLLTTTTTGSPVTISQFTARHIKAFERWSLNQGYTPGYVSLHMRCLRKIFNDINGQGNQLFSQVNTNNCQTEKRAVSEETVRQIRTLHARPHTNMTLARQVFLFCFYAMGMPLVDAAFLKKSQYQGGYITYRRQKTKRMIRIKVCAELNTLINKLTPANSPYLLPILTTADSSTSQKQYRRFYQRYMRALKHIGREVGSSYRLTSYTPRHTWASIAYKNGVNINDIAQALGHANTNVTYMYIKELTCQQLENANHIVMQAVQ